MAHPLLFTAVVLAAILAPAAVEAQADDPPPTAGRATLINGTTEAKPHGDWSGTFQNTGINLLSARQTRAGVLVRVKRLIKPGSDAAKEFARGIPLFSTAANWATLGLYNRALKSDGAAVRATWLSLNCANKTFNVSGDGYSWQNIYNDQYGQAEDLYYQFCVTTEGQPKPPYLALPPADSDMLRSAQLEK
ncbi:MAG: hypothetical protein ACK41W_08085 [Cyanobacteriota bacterium]|jgi:hypothetical protein